MDGGDSGVEIARALGLHARTFEANAYRKLDAMQEAEFVASGETGHVHFAVLEELLPQRIVVTGYHGDKVWDRWNRKVTPDIVRGDASGTGLAEFRLRVGFINAAPAFWGCVRHPEVHAITLASEMQAWTLGTEYDRPIPRRIAEEGGVPRALFGQVKRATTRGRLESRMSPVAQAAFDAYCAAHRQSQRVLVVGAHNALFLAKRLNVRLCMRLEEWGRRLEREARLPCVPLPPRFNFRAGKTSFLMPWGVATVSRRYAVEP